MPLPTPIYYADQLATALGVKEVGSKGHLHPDRNARRIAVVQARTERDFPGMGPDEVDVYMEGYLTDRSLLKKIAMISGPLRDYIFTEFALRYLPNLLEAFRSPINDLLHNRWTRILSLVSALPIFGVFMKSSHPAVLGFQEDVMKKFVVLMPDLTIFTSRYQQTRTDAIRTPLLPRPRARSYLPPQSRRLPRPLRLFSTSSSSDGSVTPQTSSPTTSVSLQSEGTAYSDMPLSVTAALMSLTTWLRRLPSSKESFEEAVDKRSWWRCEVGKKQKRVGCSGKGDEQLLSCG